MMHFSATLVLSIGLLLQAHVSSVRVPMLGASAEELRYRVGRLLNLPKETLPGQAGFHVSNEAELHRNRKERVPVGLSHKGRSEIQELIESNPDGKKILIAYPTLPVSLKGSDSRPIDAVKYLTQAGFEVDFIFWRSFGSEVGLGDYDDEPDRFVLVDAGVQNILGPYDNAKLSDSHTFISWYNAVLFWMWPDIQWLDALMDMVEHIKSQNGKTKMIAAVDDAGLASRMLQGGLKEEKKETSLEQVQTFVLSKRPKEYLGSDVTESYGNDDDESLSVNDFDQSILDYATVVMHQEMFLYTVSDILVGINAASKNFLKKMVPAKLVHVLSYVSPVQPHFKISQPTLSYQELVNPKPFQDRADYIFFGYNNFANNSGLSWFLQMVLPHVNSGHRLHIVGHVSVPEVCSCDTLSPSPCRSLHPKVVCHGAIDEKELDELIMSSRLAINPVMEQSGVATKTCRAMAYGTPVIVTEQDGTFAVDRESIGGTRCSKGDTGARCFTEALNELLVNEDKWNMASMAAPKFIAEHYGNSKYSADWLRIIRSFSTKTVEVIIEGDARYGGESLASQNWHIAKTLSKMPYFEVTVLGDDFEPPIDGVQHTQTAKDQRSPFPTGFQADVVIRQSWPPKFDTLPVSFCGSGCRVIQILPWEFGSLPETWMPRISDTADFVWAPSEYNKRIFHKSGFSPSRTVTVPAGVDCNSLLAQQSKTTGGEGTDKHVTFIFTGGFLPRTGVDILLEEWEGVFCGDSFVRLVLHTSYELGFDKDEMLSMKRIITRCQNIEWVRGEWTERDIQIEMLKNSDVYISPFRSEGLGIPVLEATMIGLSTVATVGGTVVDDYFASADMFTEAYHQNFYPVQAFEDKCTHFPCSGNEVCAFQGKCEKLVSGPTWFEVDREDLRKQMKEAYRDVMLRRNEADQTRATEKEMSWPHLMSFCWSNLGEKYRESIMSALHSPVHRSLPATSRDKHIVLAGMVRDAAVITSHTLEFVTRMSCVHNVAIHVVARSGTDELHSMYQAFRGHFYPLWNCAPIHIVQEPVGAVLTDTNRINKLQTLREFQRTEIASLLGGSIDRSVVILADLDLLEMPPAEKVIEEATEIAHYGDVDVLCSTGVQTAPHGYYDTFSTVLFPDTWVYPVNDRATEQVWPEEDQDLILDDRGDFTAEDLISWFEEKGMGSKRYSPVPVRSCFGGLAIYRAEKWLDFRCKYTSETAADKKYSNKADGQPCEHVVFHNCLARVDPAVVVAVQPDMRTTWMQDSSPELATSKVRDLLTSISDLLHLSANGGNRRRLQSGNATANANTVLYDNGFRLYGNTTTNSKKEAAGHTNMTLFHPSDDSPVNNAYTPKYTSNGVFFSVPTYQTRLFGIAAVVMGVVIHMI